MWLGRIHMVNNKRSNGCRNAVKSSEESLSEEKQIDIEVDDRDQGTKEDDTKTERKMTADSSGDRTKRSRDDDQEGIVVQTSGRISKKPRWDYDPYSPPKKSGYTKKAKSHAAKPLQKKVIQANFWSTQEKDYFFEAIKEYGRDWKAIHAKIKKHLKKNATEKTPEHIRQFYYRAWHKIAKYLTCPEGVDRQVLEIFGLICYGEFRKRIGTYAMDAQLGNSLNEMVFKGSTSIKYKRPGTRKCAAYRIRTPRCTMLEKLNNLEGIKLQYRKPTTIKLPTEVVVELRPKTNDAWAKVQTISQNPRIRTKVGPDRRLSSLIDYMNKKWKPLRLRMKEHLRGTEKPEQEIKLYTTASSVLSSYDVTRLKPLKLNLEQQQNLGLEAYMRILENMSSPIPRPFKRPHTKSNQSTETKNSQIPDVKSEKESLEVEIKTEKDSRSADMKSDKDSHISNTNDEQISAGAFHTIGQAKDCTDSEIDKIKNVSETDCVQPLTSSNDGDGLPENPFVLLGTLCEPTAKITNDSASSKATIKSDLSSSPESRIKQMKRESLDSSKSANMSEDDKVSEGIVDRPEEIVQDGDIMRKIEIVRSGMAHTEAEGITIADLYLMLGMPRKVVIEYEWVDIKPQPDYLNLGALTNMLRRLTDIAKMETTMFSKSKPSQQDICCTCNASKVNTPPNAKRGSRRGMRKEPMTPKGVRKSRDDGSTDESASSSSSAGAFQQVSGCVMSPPFDRYYRQTDELLHKNTSPGSSRSSSKDGVFKVPVSVAPRPCAQTGQQSTSPITVNNIAQKLSPTALMERITQANKHTEFFKGMPPRRQRRNRLRRPLIVQRRILPKPFLDMPEAGYSSGSNSSFVRNSMMPPARLPADGSGQVIKVMNPADVQSVTLKSVVGPEEQLKNQVPVIVKESTVETITSISSHLPVSHSLPNMQENIPFQQIPTSSGLVPVAALDPFIAQNKTYNSHTAAAPSQSSVAVTNAPVITTTSQTSLITQAAMVTGITMVMPSDGSSTENTDGVLLSLKSSEDSGGDNTIGACGNISALLDISLPSVNGDTTDKFIGLSLESSNSSFNVSALIDKVNVSATPQQEPRLELHTNFASSQGLSTPTQLSPSKEFKHFSNPPDEPWLEGEDFNLSNFLSDSPCKKPASATVTSQPSSVVVPSSNAASSVIPSNVPLINECSRDSIISKSFDFSVVDGTLQSMLNENSIDYASKFAGIARELETPTHADDKPRTLHG